MVQAADIQAGSLGNPNGGALSFGVQTTESIDFSDKNNLITTKIYHGVSIVSGSSGTNSGVLVGRVQSWQPDAYTREGVHIYELSHLQWGRPVDYVPGKVTGFTIAVTRAEVWAAEMERAFTNTSKATGNTGSGLYNDLMDQGKPFTVSEWWFQGIAGYLVWTYTGCWFQNKNMEAITADGDGVAKISATLAYVSRTHTGSAPFQAK